MFSYLVGVLSESILEPCHVGGDPLFLEISEFKFRVWTFSSYSLFLIKFRLGWTADFCRVGAEGNQVAES